MSFSINLSTKDFARAAQIAGNDVLFRFVIENEEVKCHKFVAAYLSQTVSDILVSDPTINQFRINIANDLNSEKTQQKVLMIHTNLEKLVLGQKVEISQQNLDDFLSGINQLDENTTISDFPPTLISSLLLLNESLKNDEINEQICRHVFTFMKFNNENKEMTKDEIAQKLILMNKVEIFLRIIANSQGKENTDFFDCAIDSLVKEYGEIIDEIASHFYEIDETICFEMNDKFLESILSSPKLRIESEDALLTTLLNRRKHICSNLQSALHEFFFEKIQFEFLTEKTINRFLTEIEFDEIRSDVWSQIKKRLVLPVTINSPNKKLQFEYDSSKPFNGILKHLTSISNGNIQTNQTVEIKASKLCCGQYETLVDYQKEDGRTHVNGSPSPRWLQIDFKSRKIQTYSYLIKSPNNHSAKLRSWKVEVSNDGLHWITIDERKDVSELNGNYKMKLFEVQKISEPSQYFRIITNQDNWSNSDGFALCKLELFGYMK